MSKPLPLPVFDRRAGKRFTEFMDDTPTHYESRPRSSLKQILESHPLYDWFLAAYQDSRRSAKKIEPFIRKHHIDMSEFEPVIYRSYAEFFERRLRPGVRTFPKAADEMGACAEARYFGWERLDPEQQFPVKGASLNAEKILGDKKLVARFIDGPTLLVRLSPVDYHHVHYPDDGTTSAHYRRGSRLWTVNQNALRNMPDILFRNERHISILDTNNFGTLGFVEIGALSVGRIVQVHPTGTPYARGEEKSLFRFGGSAIVVFGEARAWRPWEDVLENTREGVETLLRLGEPVARRVN
jgi:phosphatidylserine decarboxylase